MKNLVVGVPFATGQSRVPAEPIPSELLAQGFPKDPARYAQVEVGDLYFEDDDEGNYAK